MSEAASRLLATFDALSPREQHEVIAAMLRRSGQLPDAVLSDQGLADLADHRFQALDAEESHGNDGTSG